MIHDASRHDAVDWRHVPPLPDVVDEDLQTKTRFETLLYESGLCVAISLTSLVLMTDDAVHLQYGLQL